MIPRRWPASAREAAAMLNQARFLAKNLPECHHEGPGPRVVLLHGLYATAGVFSPLRERLHRELSASTHSFSYPPGPGIEELTERLEVLVSRIEGSQRIHLLGHSLGGLVMRNYVLSGRCDSRVVQTITLASPYLGSRRSWLVPAPAGSDIAAGAPVLDRLREEDTPAIHHLSVLAEEDAMILPGAVPAFGDVATIPHVGHNGVLFHPEVHRLIVDRIRSYEETRRQ